MSNLSDKVKGLLAYLLSIIGGVIFLFVDKEASKNVKMHAAQSLTLMIAYVVLNVAVSIITSIVYIPFISSAVSIGYTVLWIIGMVNAYQEKDAELPVIVGIAKSLFGKQIDAE